MDNLTEKILVTGSTGFLGRVLCKRLSQKYSIVTCGRSVQNTIICDLSVEIPQIGKNDYVIHAAGLAHTKVNAKEHYSVNLQSTINLTRALDIDGLPKSLIFISTIAVYGSNSGINITEDHPLLGKTSYALSKIRAEQFLLEWGDKNNVNIVILRLPLVVGQDPPGNLAFLKKGIINRYYFRIGNGDARKSMVLAEDVANIIENCFQTNGIFNLTDQVDPTVAEFDLALCKYFGRNVRSIPIGVAKLLALPSFVFPFWPLNKDRISKLTSALTFSSRKASLELDWRPISVISYISKHGI